MKRAYTFHTRQADRRIDTKLSCLPCCTCSQTLPTSSFYVDGNRYRSTCKECDKKRTAKNTSARYKTDDAFRQSIIEQSKKRYQANKAQAIKAVEEKRFDGKRNAIVQRDAGCCIVCGLTRDDHRKKFGCDLNVHHRDEQGRGCDDPNNQDNNLITLCKPCHRRVHLGQIEL